ncbi:uncharacterized protein LOC127719541 isoform X3 [Mytilus californianus]|uniref:uncharacterized protein LOC127719541 isoform X2 n=1 Tax=Mytilus californianus TaxID=6549 RepID=UPI002246666B|nr:uncharacterized protein LOC127719541 isoform X2 [Mytilus californianus]XP_052081719.1 uncharacterized protein LOC127719541 isoform X3 [Mytilus californianus]
MQKTLHRLGLKCSGRSKASMCLLLLLVILHFSIVEAGICYSSYACSYTGYESQSYKIQCGWFDWDRCTRYRSAAKTYYRRCYTSHCCSGYTGSSCSQAICYGSTSCPNGGSCSLPNTCVCAPGFGGPQCADVNECQLGTHTCQQLCTNTFGSFTCSCRTGYTLNSDLITCTDIDECVDSNGGCSEYCRNLDGSYECYCKTGLHVASDGKTCIDIDECSSNNGGCEQVCKNDHAVFRCECYSGFSIDTDGQSCQDIDECLGSNKCTQSCNNTIGSYTCSCNQDYQLESDGFTCTDINDCVGVRCLNDGSCLDFPGLYTCKCKQGFEGKHCETDIDECLYLNGGCEDQCENINGSFHCECRGSTTLDKNGVSCRGDTDQPTVFQTHKIARRLLPRGCAFVNLMSCQGVGNGLEIKLSSTDSWYRLNSNSSVHYTYGIVFAEAEEFSIPISVSGLVVATTSFSFELFTGSVLYLETDGTKLSDMHDDNCLLFNTTPKDIYDFVSSGSFIGTVFDSLRNKLPSWLQFSKSGVGLLSVTDLKTHLTYGNNVDKFQECYGAPVFNNRLYNVFIFGSDISFSIYGDQIHMPAPLRNNKFCVIVDICQNLGGTIFIMLPAETGAELSKVGIFSDLTKTGLTLTPRGIGLSLGKDINVHYKTSELELWNGDEMFYYRVFESANVWLYAGIEYASRSDSLNIDLKGEADIFLAVPSVSSLLIDIFMEQWNGLLQFKHFSINPTVRLDFWRLNITFVIKTIASLEVYTSVGGEDNRIWCGNAANPPGIFASFLVDYNPFKSIPLLENWMFAAAVKIHAFVTTEEKLSLQTEIDVVNNILQTKDIVERFLNLVDDFRNESIDALSGDLQQQLSKLSFSVSELSSSLTDILNSQSSLQNISTSMKLLWDKFITIKKTTRKLLDELEFHAGKFVANLTNLLESEIARIGRNINLTISRITSKVFSLVKSYTGAGFRFTAFVRIFSLDFSSMGVELVHSTQRLGECNKFRKVYELLHGEPAIRVLARGSHPIKLGYFLSLETVALSIAIGNGKFVAHAHIDVSVLGMKASGDLFISSNGLYVVIEGNIWNIFLARVTLSVELGRKWYELTFALKGILLATSHKLGSTTAANSDFQVSYLTGLRLFATKLANEANKRLTAVQNGLSSAQKALTRAQQKLSNAQNKVRDCHSSFDNAISKLETVKRKVDDAKIPFERALETLRNAQRKVNNLCKIRHCSYLCIPGFRLRTCGGWIRYPCFKYTSCMFKVPNLLCEAANLFCRGVRALAYIALEAAKILVRVPMIIFETVKAALTIAQNVVDNARVVLYVAEGILEVAKFGLEAAKGGLEVAKGAIEAVKFTVKAGLYVFDLIVLGIQQLIDVKNCGFEIEMSTHDKALFEVSCEVKAFGLGWTTFRFWFDFRHPVTSIWRIAKSTVKTLFKSVTSVFGKRKRRDVSFKAVSKIHHILRLFKRDTFDNSNNETMYLNDTIFHDGNWTSDIEYTIEYYDRIRYFEHNCKLFNNVHSFLTTSFYYFLNISDETVRALNESTHYRNEIQNITMYSTVNSMTLESAGISEEVAYNDYNLTINELNAVMEDVKINLKEDPVMSEIGNVTELAYRMVDSGIDEANSLPLINLWMLGMENFTFDFFDENDCSNFQDCLQHAFSVFYDLFSDDSIENTELNRNLTVTIEDNILMLILNESLLIQDMYKLSLEINDSLNDLMEANMFCSTPPTFSSPLPNTTVLVGDYLSLVCNATGDPDPAISWFFNDKRLKNETNPELRYDEATTVLSGLYRCIAENVVLNTTSDEAYVNVIECPLGTFYESGLCLKCPKGAFQYKWNQLQCENCKDGYTTLTTGSVYYTDCYDIDECITNVSRCEQSCKNTNGSFTCSCKWIYELAPDGKSCSELSMLLKVMVCTFIGIAALVVGVITLKIWKGRQMKNNKIRPTFIIVCESIQSPPKDHSFILNRKMELTSHT